MGRYPDPLQPWLQANMQVVIRGSGLVYFAAIYLLHRRHYRAMQMMGIESPNGWGIGFACAALGILTTLVIGLTTTQ
jgi:hypothetical protein